MIMGGVLEIGKLVTPVRLHKYWRQAKWWLKSYLRQQWLYLFITSMGIFGFPFKALFQQTSASEESVAQVQQIDSEIGRLNGVIARADEKIKKLELVVLVLMQISQAQIDKEQERIHKAFDSIKSQLHQQNKIIEDARATDNNRTKPMKIQLTNIPNEITRLEDTAREYEDKIATLDVDNKSVTPTCTDYKNRRRDYPVTNSIKQ